MGNLGAVGMAGAVEEGQVSLTQALEWHLSSNHFPPVSSDFIPIAERAIELANEDQWDERIQMPNGVTLTVGQIADGLHLHAFIEYDDEGE